MEEISISGITIRGSDMSLYTGLPDMDMVTADCCFTPQLSIDAGDGLGGYDAVYVGGNQV